MSLCIATAVNRNYVWYIPLFNYCLKRAYPEYEVRIFIPEYVSLSPEYRINCVKSKVISHSDNGYRVALMRFLEFDCLEEFDYALVTDIDIMHFLESPNILEYHLSNMEKYDTDCYDNYVSTPGQFPGVHFITKEWWKKTEAARSYYRACYSGNDIAKDQDEQTLYKIVQDSKLPMPGRTGSGIFHGVHLGRYRGKNFKQVDGTVGGQESLWIYEMLKDPEFMKLVEICGNNNSEIARIFDLFKELVYID